MRSLSPEAVDAARALLKGPQKIDPAIVDELSSYLMHAANGAVKVARHRRDALQERISSARPLSDLARALRDRRRYADLTIDDVAKRTRMSESAVCRFESGERRPTPTWLKHFAAVVGGAKGHARVLRELMVLARKDVSSEAVRKWEKRG